MVYNCRKFVVLGMCQVSSEVSYRVFYYCCGDKKYCTGRRQTTGSNFGAKPSSPFCPPSPPIIFSLLRWKELSKTAVALAHRGRGGGAGRVRRAKVTELELGIVRNINALVSPALATLCQEIMRQGDMFRMLL